MVDVYDQAWPGRFEAPCRVPEPALHGVPHRIEHVGSTRIPRMAAKPIIDLDLVIQPGGFPLAKRRLESLGYVHEGDLGISGREAFAPGARPLADLPSHHLYVCVEGSAALRNHLAFRGGARSGGTG